MPLQAFTNSQDRLVLQTVVVQIEIEFSGFAGRPVSLKICELPNPICKDRPTRQLAEVRAAKGILAGDPIPHFLVRASVLFKPSERVGDFFSEMFLDQITCTRVRIIWQKALGSRLGQDWAPGNAGNGTGNRGAEPDKPWDPFTPPAAPQAPQAAAPMPGAPTPPTANPFLPQVATKPATSTFTPFPMALPFPGQVNTFKPSWLQ